MRMRLISTIMNLVPIYVLSQERNRRSEHIFTNASIKQRVDAISIVLTSALVEVAEP